MIKIRSNRFGDTVLLYIFPVEAFFYSLALKKLIVKVILIFKGTLMQI